MDQVCRQRFEIDGGGDQVVDHGLQVRTDPVPGRVMEHGAPHQRRDLAVAAEDPGVVNAIEKAAQRRAGQGRQRRRQWTSIDGIAGAEGHDHLVHLLGQPPERA